MAGAEGGWGGRFLLLGLMLRRFCGGVGVFHAPSPDFFAQDDTAAAGVVGDDGEAVEVSSRLIQPFMAATVEMTQCREDGEGSA